MTVRQNRLTGISLGLYLRRLMLLLCGLLIGLVVLLSALLLLLDDDAYRDALIWSADTFIDARLEIKDNFSLDLGRNILLSADTVQLRAKDGSYKLDIGSFDGSLRFGDYIKTGTFWINSLALADVRLEIIGTDDAQQDETWQLYVPPIVVETVQMENLSVVYTPGGKEKPQTFELNKLVIDEAQDQGPIKVTGTAVVNARPFLIEGELGSLAQLDDTSQPYPIDLTVSSDKFEASLKGGIDDLVSGEGLALQIQVKDKDFTRTLRSFDKTLPDLGSLELSANLIGDYDAPRFEKIDLQVQRENGIGLTLRGELDGIAEVRKARLSATLMANELAAVSALFDDSLPELGAVNASGTVNVDGGKLSLDDIKLALGPTDKPVIKADGAVQRDPSGKNRLQFNFDASTDEFVHTIKKTLTPQGLGRLQGKFTVTELDGHWKVESIEADSSESDLYQLRVDATSENGEAFEQLELHTDLQIPDPARFGKQFGIDLNGYAAYQATGVLKGDEKQVSYQGKIQVGKTHSKLELTATLTGDRPKIQGKFVVPELYLPDIGIDQKLLTATEEPGQPGSDTPAQSQTTETSSTADAAQPTTEAVSSAAAGADDATTTPAVGGQYIFEREKLNFELLRDVDLDFAIEVDKIIGVDYSIEGLDGQIRLSDGNLEIKPLRLSFEGGDMNLELELNTTDTPQFSFSIVADHVKLKHLFEQMQQEVPVEGHGSLHIDIKSEGHSAHEMVSALSGSIKLTLETALIPRIYVTLLSADVFGWVMSPTASSYVRLDCAMANFDIEQGVAKSNLLISDGPHLSIEGSSTVDLGEETIDMVLLPRQKKKVFSEMSPVNIKGPLADPEVHSIPAEAAATKIGAVLLVPVVALPVMLFEKLFGGFGGDDADVGCSKLIAELKKKTSAN